MSSSFGVSDTGRRPRGAGRVLQALRARAVLPGPRRGSSSGKDAASVDPTPARTWVVVDVEQAETLGLPGRVDVVLARWRVAEDPAGADVADDLPATREAARWLAVDRAAEAGAAVLLVPSSPAPRRRELVTLLERASTGQEAAWLVDPAGWAPGAADAQGSRTVDPAGSAWLAGVPDVPMWLGPDLVRELAAADGPRRSGSLRLATVLADASAVSGVGLVRSLAAEVPPGVTGPGAAAGGAARWRAWDLAVTAERGLLVEDDARRAAWAAGRLRDDLLSLVPGLDGAQVDEQRRWSHTVARLLDDTLGGDPGARVLPVTTRAFATVVASGDPAVLERLLTWAWDHPRGPELVLEGGRLCGDLRPAGIERLALEELAEADRSTVVSVVRVVPRGGGRGAVVDLVVVDRGPEGWSGPELVALSTPDGDLSGRRVADPVAEARAATPDPGSNASTWRLEPDAEALPALRSGTTARVRRADGSEAVVRVAGAAAVAAWRWEPDGRRRAVAPVVVSAVALAEGPTMRVTGRWTEDAWPEGPPADVDLVATGDEVVVQAPLRTVTGDPGAFEVDLPLRAERWGRPDRPVPVGPYALRVRVPGGDDVPLAVEDGARSELAAHLPWDLVGHRVRVRLTEGPAGRLNLAVVPPLPDADLGPVGGRASRRAYLDVRERPVDPGLVLLQSYWGRWATDSQLSLHHTLRRLRPDLRLAWSVRDHSLDLPAGAEPLVVGSRAWFEAWGRAGHVCLNTPSPPWFEPREGQRVLQTFHGYPAKTMGISHWEGAGDGPSRVAHLTERIPRDWDLILTPAPEMDEHYRRQYAYDGPIVSGGLPRVDDLVGRSREVLRRRGREVVGAGAGTKVLLYAPTWREELAVKVMGADMDTHLDVHGLADQLGDDWLVLLRGHRFHARGRRPTGSARVLDVTLHPEINELVAASDAAVLDYSSLRFETALAEVPTVFLVPDLADYTGPGRGFLFDFEPTAPGPLVASTAEAAGELADLDDLRRRTAGPIAQMNARYNHRHDGSAAERVVAAWFDEDGEDDDGPGVGRVSGP